MPGSCDRILPGSFQDPAKILSGFSARGGISLILIVQRSFHIKYELKITQNKEDIHIFIYG